MSGQEVPLRSRAYAQDRQLSAVDKFGVWLSRRRIDQTIGGADGKRLVDLGCGYDAQYVRSLMGRLAGAAVCDVALAPDLKALPGLRVIEGVLPGAVAELDAHDYDIVLCMSVLEHVAEPLELLRQCRRLAARGGVCIINVPTWLGKRLLELAAFRLHVAPFEEMDDHKRYYDPRDLWPMLVEAGFRPHEISCRRHKFGLNTVAICRIDPT